MNKILAEKGRTCIKELLVECTKDQKNMFKRMYAKNTKLSEKEKIELDINTVVDEMDEDKIDLAMAQCALTVTKNKKG